MGSKRNFRSACALVQFDKEFIIHLKTLWILGDSECLAKTLGIHGCAGWSESSLGAYCAPAQLIFASCKTTAKHISTEQLGIVAGTCLFIFLNSIPLRRGVYRDIHYFHFSAQKHRLWVLLEPPRGGGSNEYPQSMFWAEMWKISDFLS